MRENTERNLLAVSIKHTEYRWKFGMCLDDLECAATTVLPASADYLVGYVSALSDAKKAINKQPAADVAPVVHGGWIPLLESEISGWNPEFAGKDPIGGYMCSVCKEEAIYDCNDEFVLSKFCPNCGAKMDESKGDFIE